MSPCTLGKPDASGRQLWAPCPREHASFEGLERALETTLHPSIHGYYTRYWFPPVPALADDGQLELIGMWNKDDFESLQSNIIGHALQQRRRKLPLTVFFALPLPESELCLSIENHTGAVVLEEAGSPPVRTICDSLVEFLNALEPDVGEP